MYIIIILFTFCFANRQAIPFEFGLAIYAYVYSEKARNDLFNTFEDEITLKGITYNPPKLSGDITTDDVKTFTRYFAAVQSKTYLSLEASPNSNWVDILRDNLFENNNIKVQEITSIIDSRKNMLGTKIGFEDSVERNNFKYGSLLKSTVELVSSTTYPLNKYNMDSSALKNIATNALQVRGKSASKFIYRGDNNGDIYERLSSTPGSPLVKIEDQERLNDIRTSVDAFTDMFAYNTFDANTYINNINTAKYKYTLIYRANLLQIEYTDDAAISHVNNINRLTNIILKCE